MSSLDFVIFGPGRSGTTAFAYSFNLHPKVFCATEFLPVKADHSTFAMPDDLLRHHLPQVDHRRASIEMLRQKLAEGPVTFYGNKMPNYYFRLENLRREVPDLKLFYIYRSPREFVHSWDRRADTEGDRWHEGARGIFGALEQAFCLKRILSFPVHMVSYRALFYRDPSLMRQVCDRLGADPKEFNQKAFEDNLRPAEPSTPADPFYDEFFSEFRFDGTDAYFDANPLSASTDPEFRAVVEKQLASLPRPARFAEYVQRMDAPAHEYASIWRKQVRGRSDNREDPTCQWLIEYAARAERQLLAQNGQEPRTRSRMTLR